MLAISTHAGEVEREQALLQTYDAMQRKARAGHVTGGRTFGYDNVDVTDGTGRRLRVERRINDTEAAVVRQIFERRSRGEGIITIAKRLNAAGAPAGCYGIASR